MGPKILPASNTCSVVQVEFSCGDTLTTLDTFLLEAMDAVHAPKDVMKVISKRAREVVQPHAVKCIEYNDAFKNKWCTLDAKTVKNAFGLAGQWAALSNVDVGKLQVRLVLEQSHNVHAGVLQHDIEAQRHTEQIEEDRHMIAKMRQQLEQQQIEFERHVADTTREAEEERLSIVEMNKKAEEMRRQVEEKSREIQLQAGKDQTQAKEVKQQAEEERQHIKEVKRQVEQEKNEVEKVKQLVLELQSAEREKQKADEEQVKETQRELEEERRQVKETQRELEEEQRQIKEMMEQIEVERRQIVKETQHELEEEQRQIKEMKEQFEVERRQIVKETQRELEEEQRQIKEMKEQFEVERRQIEEQCTEKNAKTELSKQASPKTNMCSTTTSVLEDAQILQTNLRTMLENARKTETSLHGELASVSAKLALLRKQKMQSCPPMMAAEFVRNEPLSTVADDDVAACGDATKEFAEMVAKYGAHQAFRFGRIKLNACPDVSHVTVSAKIVATNTGETPWPQTTILVIVDGEALSLPIAVLGPVLPGETTELIMELLVPSQPQCGIATSTWQILDSATGILFGPLLVFETLWMKH